MPASRVLPTTQTLTWDRIGMPPNITTLSISILDPDVLYVQYSINFDNTSVNWLYAPGLESSYLESNFLELDFVNLDRLPAGNYKATVVIELSNSETYIRTMTSVVNLVLSGASPTQITVDKPIYDVVYNRSNNQLSGDLTPVIVNNTENTPLKFWQVSNVFAPAENFTNNFSIADNPANPLATNTELPPLGNYYLGAKILKQTGEFVTGFNVNLIIVDGGISVLPDNLTFEVFKGTSEKTATLLVTNPLGIDFEIIEIPNWLSISPTFGNSNLSINIETSTSTFDLGNYSGVIKFTYNGEFLEIPVTLALKSFIYIDENSDFCLDLPEVIISRKNEAAKFIKITLETTYTVLGKVIAFTKTYQLTYFLDVAKFNLGEKLHRHFPRVKRHSFEDTEIEYMKIISAKMKVEELNSNYEILFTESVTNIKLYPGKKPAAFPLLSSGLNRKKNKGSIIFTSEVVNELVILKKRVEVDVPNPLVLGTKTINFYDFPQTFSPVDVQWENQNLCPDWFTFTGDYKITPDYNHIYARNIFNAQNEKYDFSKLQTLTINTGMILAKERYLISEIIESKLSFLRIQGKIYRCFNVTKKNVEIDSTEELIARDLEFIIVEE